MRSSSCWFSADTTPCAHFFLFGIAFGPKRSCQQTAQGILAGTVVDSTGALVDGATITARNLATGRDKQYGRQPQERFAFPPCW